MDQNVVGRATASDWKSKPRRVRMQGAICAMYIKHPALATSTEEVRSGNFQYSLPVVCMSSSMACEGSVTVMQ